MLTLAPELDEAFRSGRCTSPRTLYELANVRKTQPEQVKAIVGREGGITRSAVASAKKTRRSARAKPRKPAATARPTTLASRANALFCTRLESLVGRMTRQGAPVTSDELAAVRRRLAHLAGMSEMGNSEPSGLEPRISPGKP